MSDPVGVLGLGRMGLPMAGHLRAAGFEVIGFDSQEAAMVGASALGVAAAATPADLAARVRATFVVVASADEVERVCFGPHGIIEGAVAGDAVFLCSSLSPEISEDVAARFRVAGVQVADATLVGAVHVAVAGRLLVFAGGEPALFERWDAALRSFASEVHVIGGVGTGQTAKLINNLLMWINVVGSYEALRLGMRMGVRPDDLIPAIMRGGGASWVLDHWAEDRVMPWADKDLAACLEAGRVAGLPLPMTGLARELIGAVKRDQAALDDGAARASLLRTLLAAEGTA